MCSAGFILTSFFLLFADVHHSLHVYACWRFDGYEKVGLPNTHLRVLQLKFLFDHTAEDQDAYGFRLVRFSLDSFGSSHIRAEHGIRFEARQRQLKV